MKIIEPFLQETLLEVLRNIGREVHFWVLTVDVSCATLGTEQHSWFVVQVNQALEEGVRGSDDIFNTLLALSKKLFYHEMAQKYILRVLADDLDDMRKQETSPKLSR